MQFADELTRLCLHLLDPKDVKHLRPSFLVIGVQKSGTHSLYRYLSQHPAIEPAKIKEICYFNSGINYRKGNHWYHHYFPSRTEARKNSISFEASVGYSCNLNSAERIYHYNPKMRFILILRDPVERVFSQWNMGRNLAVLRPFSDLVEHRDFHEIVTYEIDAFQKGQRNPVPILSYIPRGLYLEQIEAYLKYFPREQIFITENRQFKLHRVDVLNEILDFLELPRFAWDETKLTEHYKADYKDRTMDCETAKILSNFYRPYNEALFDFLGVRYDWQ